MRRQYTGESNPQYLPTQQDYSTAPAASQSRQTVTNDYSEPVSAMANNSGFDFNPGYAQPSPPPAQTANGGKAYPGYRHYKPQLENESQPSNWSGI